MNDTTRGALVFAVCSIAAVGAWAYATGSANEGGVDVPEGDDAQSFGVSDVLGPVASVFDQAEAIVIGTQTSLSDAGLSALMQREGFSATPYWDFKGYSIGYAHLIKPGESFTSVSQDEAAQLLRADVAWAEAAVRTAVLVPLTQGQFDALVSFAYNVGAPAFRKSTLVRLLNAGDYAGASEQFARWNMAGGQVNDALVARRSDEQRQFEG